MAQMTHYVDHVEIQKAVTRIQSYMTTNEQYSAKMGSELDSLKRAISINGSGVENKKDDVLKATRSYKNNNDACISVFNHITDMYFDAKANSRGIFTSEGDKLHGIQQKI